jgi:two-component system response regulator (stage 0 sporulation protein A)
MPYLDGIGVLERLDKQDLARRPKVLMLTAFGQESIHTPGTEQGADYYILKPFDLNILTDRLRQLFSGATVAAPRGAHCPRAG